MRKLIALSAIAFSAFAAPQAWAGSYPTASHCGPTPTTPPTLNNCGGSLTTGQFEYDENYKFNYVGGQNVTFKLTDLLPDLVTKTNWKGQTVVVTPDDKLGYFSLDREVTRQITETKQEWVCDKWGLFGCWKGHYETRTVVRTVTAWENVFKKEIAEGGSFTTLLKNGGLYALSFVQDACVTGGKNIASNIANFFISTEYCPPVSSVPVPGAALLFASSLASISLWRRRKAS